MSSSKLSEVERDGERNDEKMPQHGNDNDLLERHNVRIRPYLDSDNDAMQDMEKECIQGDSTNFTWHAVFDDFADRAKKYERYNILVMENLALDPPRAIGTASVGIKRINWLDENGSPTISWVGHAFNLRLDPSCRGRGLSRPLSSERKRVARESGSCTYLYATIAPTNKPSIRSFRPCAMLHMDYFSGVLPELVSTNDKANDTNQSDDIDCVRLSNEEGLKWITETHGTKLFFPMDMNGVLQHKHCLGEYQASTTSQQETTSSATFALWDSSASFQWQLTERGIRLPLQRIAVMFGLDVVGPRGLECLEFLIQYLRPRVLKNHQRLSCPLARNELSNQLKQVSNGILHPSAEIALVISPTSLGNETDDTRFNNITPDMIFSDPRDY